MCGGRSRGMPIKHWVARVKEILRGVGTSRYRITAGRRRALLWEIVDDRSQLMELTPAPMAGTSFMTTT